MPLTTAQEAKAWKYFIDHRAVNPNAAPAKFTKPELKAALAAAVTWIENNQASYVSALAGTAFAGAGSTADEKRRLFLAAFAHVYDVEVN